MSLRNNCRLCGNEAILRESHIVPSFVYKWLKESSVTQYLRHDFAPNKREQDGIKRALLCDDCEQKLSKWEKTFAEQVFVPLHNKEASVFPYGPWLLRFTISVSWRAVTFLKDQGLSHCSPKTMSRIDTALNTWRKVLLDERTNPGVFEQHLIPLQPITEHRFRDMPVNINTYIASTIESGISCSQSFAFLYVKMARVVLLAFIEMPNPRRWQETRIHVKKGTLEVNQYTLPMEFWTFFFSRARALKKKSKVSERQKKRIKESFQKNINRLESSEGYHIALHDLALFGKDVFQEEDNDDRSENNDS